MNHQHHQNKSEELFYGSQAMQWYGWGSPIGLSVFFVSIAACFWIVMSAIS